ncbi:MAG: prolyl oligopeptidase family serine peptidase [Chloroflexales bacterium]|nr:prolyl oligopeptidase family serine peptidase [Chloroflexales bacterium]
MPKNRTYWWIFSILMLCGCLPIASKESTAVAFQPATITIISVQPTATALSTATPGPPTPIPPTTTLPPIPIPPTTTPIPDLVAGLTIPDLRSRNYGDGEIRIGEVYNQNAGYTSYHITYPADGLQLTGLVHVPDGAGPFPVIIANRGYIAPERYLPGMDSRAFSDFMARSGYLIVAPDYRGYGGGDNGPNPFYTGYYADVLNLIPLTQTLPIACAGKVGMWGHSRGASITVAALTISDQIAAAVVYAPAPADLAVDYEQRQRQGSNQADSDTWPFHPAQNPTAYQRVSPINYLDAVTVPVMLHHGTADTVVDASASIAIAETLRT